VGTGDPGGGTASSGSQKTPAQPATDRRFQSDLWQTAPFAALHDSFLMPEDWWQLATTGVRGVTPANQMALSFAVCQMLDTYSSATLPL